MGTVWHNLAWTLTQAVTHALWTTTSMNKIVVAAVAVAAAVAMATAAVVTAVAVMAMAAVAMAAVEVAEGLTSSPPWTTRGLGLALPTTGHTNNNNITTNPCTCVGVAEAAEVGAAAGGGELALRYRVSWVHTEPWGGRVT